MTTHERRAFLVGVAIPAGGLNPSATCYLSRAVASRAKTMDELNRLSRAMNTGIACGVLLCLVALVGGVLLVTGHHDLPGALLAVGPWLTMHGLWHYYMRRS